MVLSWYEEHNVRDKISLYKDTMHKDVMELGADIAIFQAPTQEELKIAECVTAYHVGDLGKVAFIDEREK